MTTAVTNEMVAELRQSVRGVLRRAAGVREFQGDAWSPAPLDDQIWKQAGELGWTGLLAGEQWGGSAAGLSATVVVIEELASDLVSLPYLGSAVLAVSALQLAGSDEQRAHWLADLAAGTRIGTVALTGPTGRTGVQALGIVAENRDQSWVLNGRAGFVIDAPDADVFFVAARTLDGAAMFVVDPDAPGVEVVDHLAVDRSRRMGDVVLDDVKIPLRDVLDHSDAAAIAMLTERGSLAIAADACGASRRALELSIEYAKQREQFGRPIGSFQAIKHKLADMWVLVQGAQIAVAAAATALDDGDVNAPRLAAVARAYVRDAATKVTGDAIQLHGGIGYTWEHPSQRLWKRAKFDEVFLGDPSVHREHLARLLLDRYR